ncbi:VCBS repeat-containing protein [Brevibacillus fulvus]|uniref:Spore coat protein n=1 Tax=Brevibacillus fulvus TaxID=1125967 RepID=A0A939BR22_9BACL|nr:VCBS repeat-containing protein [Brevibacillus fulvus]MBM7589023.1 hypothetical protein [Brevibacillus fulvus]
MTTPTNEGLPESAADTILDVKWGDVNGDQIPELVYLVGQKNPEQTSGYVDSVKLVIIDRVTNRKYTIALPDFAGYQPTLFLGNFTGQQAKQIMVSADTGGSGGYTINRIYSFEQNQWKKLYDNDWYMQNFSNTSVNYLDGQKVRIINRSLAKEYLLDISLRDPAYLNELYDANGKLKQPQQGEVLAVGGAFPLDRNRDGVFELLLFQRIIGRYNADTLGYLQTWVTWDQTNAVFSPQEQQVSSSGGAPLTAGRGIIPSQ